MPALLKSTSMRPKWYTAVATARLASDPTRDLRGALTAPKVTHYGAITDASRVGELLRAIDGYEGQGFTKLAMQLAPHVFVRPGELRHAEWSEIDLDSALWIIPAEKMKMRKPHHVPLSRQAVALFRAIHAARRLRFAGPPVIARRVYVAKTAPGGGAEHPVSPGERS